jgi:ABC-type Fe3+/spermidine/putrescine transport system ATPase subunit
MGQIGVHDITKDWSGVLALKNINLEVREGEFLSILGPSGCGKSTMLRIIAGLEEPTSGSIHIAGKEVTRQPIWKRNIGFVFQNFALWPHLNVFRNVSMGLELRRVGKAQLHEKVSEALQMVQLEALADRLPSQLSGGQQQRVALARAIVLKPDVLLLDEPLSALDKNLRQDMQVELKTLQQKLSLTTVFVTHDQEEALSLSDRVVVMNKGAIEQVEAPENVYNSPASEFVAGFVGEAFFLRGTAERNPAGDVIRLPDGSVVPVVGEVESDQETVAFIRPEWVELSAVATDSYQNQARGTIERLMFFGQSSDYLVRFAGRQMKVKRRADTPAFKQGEQVAIACTARALPTASDLP